MPRFKPNALPEEEKPNHWAWVLGAFVALLLYVLSIGPAVVAAGKIGGSASAIFQVVYAPVNWLYHNTPLHGPLEFYVSLWIK